MAPPKIPGARIAATCPICGKEYTYKRSSPKQTCSRACHLASLPKHITTNCPTCGKEFTYRHSWPRKYCSNVCAGKANIGNIAHFTPSGIDATCEQCGKGYRVHRSESRGRFCSLQCFGAWQKVHGIRGAKHHQWGKPFGRSALPPNPAILTCPICGKVYEAKQSQAKRGRRCCSRKCQGIWHSENNVVTGPNNPHWKSGRVPDYYGPNWPRTQRAVRERDQVCLGCGVSPEELGRELDVHHLTPFRDFGLERYEEANRLDNLVALCPACHKRWEHSGRRP